MIDSAEYAEFGIEIQVAGPGLIAATTVLPGETIIPPDNLAYINPRYPGVVKEVRKHIGDQVARGDVLAIIEGNESLVDFELRAMIDGTVVEKHLTIGEVIQGTENSFVVADLSTLWIMLRLYQKDHLLVKEGQVVTIHAGYDIPPARGVIEYISPLIDESTRTASARVVLKNPRGLWKPGLFVRGTVRLGAVKVPLAIPVTAIEYVENEAVVFVEAGRGYEARHVRLGRKNDSMVEVLGGLESGERYVSKGGFTLKAEMMKGGFSDGHSH